jgi:hypothetical protein
MTESLGKIYLDFQRHVVRGIIDQKNKIRLNKILKTR